VKPKLKKQTLVNRGKRVSAKLISRKDKGKPLNDFMHIVHCRMLTCRFKYMRSQTQIYA